MLGPRQGYDIQGWRKSLERVAAFFFTEHQSSYAARTGRPDNVGVVGVAVFRKMAEPEARLEQPRPRTAPPASDERDRPAEDRLEGKRQAGRLLELIAALPEAQREAFLLQQEGGMSVSLVTLVGEKGGETLMPASPSSASAETPVAQTAQPAPALPEAEQARPPPPRQSEPVSYRNLLYLII